MNPIHELPLLALIELIGVIFGATGFWKIAAHFLIASRRKRSRNLWNTDDFFVEANKEMVRNFNGLSTEIKFQLLLQKDRIDDLEEATKNIQQRLEELNVFWKKWKSEINKNNQNDSNHGK